MYPDWRSLLSRLAVDAKARAWHGPIVIDELPYLVLSSPELPSVLQQWLDHDVRRNRLVVVVVGSSQRMMQGLVLHRESPLYGRAAEVLDLQPLRARVLPEGLHTTDVRSAVEAYAAWGGVPRYWELAWNAGEGSTTSKIDDIVLDPVGPLHQEPDYLLMEEVPSARELRPLLDANGFGSHRISEIGGRLDRPATSLARPLLRLMEMGLVARDVPFGEHEKSSKKALYRLSDPFFRMWFRVVAPHRSFLATASPALRRSLLKKHWDALVAAAWEDLCRQEWNEADWKMRLGSDSGWAPRRRWWKKDRAEWDMVAEDPEKERLLIGEAKWSKEPFSQKRVERLTLELLKKPLPDLPGRDLDRGIVRALFVPEVTGLTGGEMNGVQVITGKELLGIA